MTYFFFIETVIMLIMLYGLEFWELFLSDDVFSLVSALQVYCNLPICM